MATLALPPIRDAEAREAPPSTAPPGPGEDTAVGVFALVLEGFMQGVWPKGSRKLKIKKTQEEQKITEQIKKTKVQKPKIAFGPTKDAKTTIKYNKCVVSFTIRIDKGNVCASWRTTRIGF